MKSIQQKLQERSKLNQGIRAFFASREYLEVETPILVASPDMEPTITPFETTLIDERGEEHAAALSTSPEYSMKKLLGQGFDALFTLTKVFRNEEELGGKRHNHEFTLLEWYRQGEDYHSCMKETEELIRVLAENFQRSLPAFKKIRVNDLFLKHLQADITGATTQDLRKLCQVHGIHTDKSDTISDLFYRLFITCIEPQLGSHPIFVYDYPPYQAALAQLTPDKQWGQRFELYIDGLELCNGFTELTDAKEQHQRFLKEQEARQKARKTVFPIDEELLRLLPSLRNPTFGNALGVDRLHMVLSQTTAIKDVLAFPSGELFSSESSHE